MRPHLGRHRTGRCTSPVHAGVAQPARLLQSRKTHPSLASACVRASWAYRMSRIDASDVGIRPRAHSCPAAAVLLATWSAKPRMAWPGMGNSLCFTPASLGPHASWLLILDFDRCRMLPCSPWTGMNADTVAPAPPAPPPSAPGAVFPSRPVPDGVDRIEEAVGRLSRPLLKYWGPGVLGGRASTSRMRETLRLRGSPRQWGRLGSEFAGSGDGG
jgi:hypothetical protein